MVVMCASNVTEEPVLVDKQARIRVGSE